MDAIKIAVETLSALTPSQRAQVLAELPESKPTAWQRLGTWLADPEDGAYRSWSKWKTEFGHRVMLEEAEVLEEIGEGPTLDAALAAAALEKLK